MNQGPEKAAATAAIHPTVALIRQRSAGWRRDGLTSALVPTMGALHDGHLTLVQAAREAADRVVVSIFVNPTQFAPSEDFAAYPRNMDADLARLAQAGVDAVFAPTTAEMYPEGFSTTVSLGGPAAGLESDFRPHFFQGVATVVAKLFLATQPDIAVFGEKDYQQLLVVKRMAADLNIPVEVRGHPTRREPDGLAMSSRNAYLSSAERSIAPRLHRALQAAAQAIRVGHDTDSALADARQSLAGAGFAIDYVALRNAETLAEVIDVGNESLRLLAAAKLGRTRLIDNIAV
jgi:pantoate--beta-alanine ligase